MLQATKRKRNGNPEKGRVRFPGIIEDAQVLGVDRTHLYRVLTGQRPSKRLLAAYKNLKKEAAR